MKSYRLDVLDDLGGSRTLNVVAESRASLQATIDEEAWVVLRIRRSRIAPVALKGNDLILFCQHMQLMLDAGLTVQQALVSLAEESETRCSKEACAELVQRIDRGFSFSRALAFVRVDNFCLAMIKTGETTGRLPELLSYAAEHLQWRDDLKAKLRSSLSYPFLILLVLTLVVPVLFVFLVPQLMVFIEGVQVELPWYTRLLVNTSDNVQKYGSSVAVGFCLFVGFFSLLWKFSDKFRLSLDQFILKIPLLGGLIHQLHLAMFSRQLSVLYAAGISIADALPLLSESSRNRFLSRQILQVSESVNEGESLHQAMQVRCFPPMLLRMVYVGELSGGLERSLELAAILYSRQAHRRSENLAAAIGPAALFVAGLIIVWLVVALILPIYDGIFSLGTGL